MKFVKTTVSYSRALEQRESEEGLDLAAMDIDDLLTLIEDIPGWDYPLAEDCMGELARRAGIDTHAYFRDAGYAKDYNDLWLDAAIALGYDFDAE